jgi:hypothetical protein
MMLQFTEDMPGLVTENDRTYFATSSAKYIEQLTDFYEHYLAVIEQVNGKALESFGLSPQYAAGFAEFITQLPVKLLSGKTTILKGQVTGPFTLGINLTDREGKCSYYDEQLHDVILKTVILKAVWQISHLSKFGLPVMIFLDEPSLLGFGKQTFITVSRVDIIRDLNEVAAAIHSHGALSGVHCEANTDWSLLMETNLDILDFDAYDHFQAIALYPKELDKFLIRGGCLGWGIVPTLDREAAAGETVPTLILRLEEEINHLVNMGFTRDLLLKQSLITPSCGAGGVLTEALAEHVLKVLHDLSLTLRLKYGFTST